MLRVAFSAACGIVAVLLIMLWVRSHNTLESWQGRVGGRAAHIQTARGRVILFALPRLHDRGYFRVPFKNFGPTTELERAITGSEKSCKVLGKMVPVFILPYWSIVVPIVLGATLLLVPWPARFSLRSLLIAVTLIGLLLGLIIATTR
jgi:hypothetical protein